MNTGISFGRYASVLFKTIVPLRALRPLLIIFAFIWIAGKLLASFYDYAWAAAFAPLGAMIVFMIIAVALPPQVIALASSRPISLLGDMRKTLLIILFTSCIALSMMVLLTINTGHWWKAKLNPLVVLLLISFLVTLSVWVCSRWSGLHGFIYLPSAYFHYIFEYLNGFHSAFLFAALVVVWATFIRWWFYWKPNKYQVNSGLLTPEQSGQYLAKRQAKLLSGRAKSWIGSRLIGVPDGLIVSVKRYLLALGLMSVLMLPGMFLFGKRAPLEFTANILVLLLLLFAFIAAQTIANNIFKNLRYIWLYSPGNREKFFFLVLKRYCLELLSFVFLAVAVAIFIEVFMGAVHPVKSWTHLFVFVLLLFSLIFHSSWFAYQLGDSNLARLIMSIGALVIWVATIFANGWFFSWVVQWKIVSPVPMLLINLVMLFLINWKVRKSMSHLNFTRMV